MARRYSIIGDQAAATDDTIIGVESAATIRPDLYEWTLGCGATPADLASILHLERFTAAGTSSAVVPVALDPDDPASLAVGGSNHTGEPTYTAAAILYKLSLNQRATFRFAANPGFGFKSPATAASGMGLQFQSSGGTAVHEATFLFQE